MSMTLKVLATGRNWGDKKPDVIFEAKISGVALCVKEFDAWEGPDGQGEAGQYYRHTHLIGKSIRDDRFDG